MENPTLEKPKTVTDIVKSGVRSYLNQNRDISVKDLLTKNSRQNAGNKLRDTLKSTALDTGKKVITHLQNNEYQWEEVSRRKKPSALKKKAKLNAALEKLKKARASVQENTAQFDKLVKTIKNTPDLSKEKTARLLRIAGKVRGMGEDFEGVFRKDDPARKTPGKTITTKAKTVGYERGDLPAADDDKKKGENREKGGPITQKQNPRVGEPDGPDDKRTKRGERKLKAIDKLTDKRKEKIKSGLKTGAKVANASAKVAGYVGSKAKSGVSAFTSGYDAKEEKTFSQYTENALVIPAIKYGLPAAATAVGAIGTYLQSRKKSSDGQGNFFGKGSEGNPYSGRYQRKGNTKQNRNARQNAIDQWRKDNGLPPDSKAEPPWPK